MHAAPKVGIRLQWAGWSVEDRLAARPNLPLAQYGGHATAWLPQQLFCEKTIIPLESLHGTRRIAIRSVPDGSRYSIRRIGKQQFELAAPVNIIAWGVVKRALANSRRPARPGLVRVIGGG